MHSGEMISTEEFTAMLPLNFDRPGSISRHNRRPGAGVILREVPEFYFEKKSPTGRGPACRVMYRLIDAEAVAALMNLGFNLCNAARIVSRRHDVSAILIDCGAAHYNNETYPDD